MNEDYITRLAKGLEVIDAFFDGKESKWSLPDLANQFGRLLGYWKRTIVWCIIYREHKEDGGEKRK